MSDQLDAVITQWLKDARHLRTIAADHDDCGDEEEAMLCEIEASRLETCAKEILIARGKR